MYMKYLLYLKPEGFINMNVCLARLLNDSFEDENSLYVLFILKFLYDFGFSIRSVVNARSVENFRLSRTHKYKTKHIQGGAEVC
jgi:hypothetical protein